MIENGDLILNYLERLGVKYVFGVPGGSIEPFYNALAKARRDKFPHKCEINRLPCHFTY